MPSASMRQLHLALVRQRHVIKLNSLLVIPLNTLVRLRHVLPDRGELVHTVTREERRPALA